MTRREPTYRPDAAEALERWRAVTRKQWMFQHLWRLPSRREDRWIAYGGSLGSFIRLLTFIPSGILWLVFGRFRSGSYRRLD